MKSCRKISAEVLVTRVEAMNRRMAQLTNLRQLVRDAETTLFAAQEEQLSWSVRRRQRKYTGPRPLRFQVGLTTRKAASSSSE
jgi:hypothetical protein